MKLQIAVLLLPALVRAYVIAASSQVRTSVCRNAGILKRRTVYRLGSSFSGLITLAPQVMKICLFQSKLSDLAEGYIFST